MSKRISRINIILLISMVLLLTACSSNDKQKSSNENMLSQIPTTELKPTEQGATTLPDDTYTKFPQYTEKDIQDAEDIIHKYYTYSVTVEYLSAPINEPGNVWDIPEEYFTDYQVGEIILFKVKASEKPLRKFYLGRKNSDDSWIILTEGY